MKVCNIEEIKTKNVANMSKCNCGGASNCNCGAGSVCAHKCANGNTLNIKKTLKEIYKK